MGLISRVSSNLQRRLSSESNPAETCKMGIFMKALSFGVAGAGIAIFRQEMAEAGGDAIRPTTLNWPHTGVFDAYDASQLKRGFQVYRQVCSACHSINKLAFRQLVDVTHDEATMKELAKEYQVLDEEPDAEDNPVLPPDFRLIRNARTSGLDFKAGEDYIYHLLTGYCEPPAGVTIAEGQHYNPYFSGGAIGMGPPLYNEIIQYEDGTPATMSQLAADVSAFLTWSSLPENDERKLMAY